ncbi:AMP-binding protein [Streptomyces viridochromogenes]|uniref:AMP-binding protein n=1 Tax=Streptomyces viridochromogenes TaxID=1938 RepID=UPI00069E2679|nr:AMP-binding protein [Streptomyces viridochromogenes]KOG19058.1 hypothetical protein ADK36_20670 [Streptomyces viridochromogenes]KOG19297.1 hypothetical protein ADK35_20530 [Streptomyces viridochromogenes]
MTEAKPAAEPRLDGLLSEAARRHGDRTAIRAGSAEPTFAELDAAATRWAAAVRRLVGTTDTVVALVSPLSPDFAAAFHGIVRSGNVVAPLNPLQRADELRHLLGVTRARLAVVTPPVRAELAAIRPSLPHLTEIVGLDEEWPWDEPPEDVPLGDVACLHFTSGTTGPAKAAVLTHRNLLVNAAQVAEAHRLGPESVVLNHLPKYHLMHLNSALYAAATQVLCTDPDPVEAVGTANRHRATHFYSIPMRLVRLAADERLPELSLRTARMIASGGSALPAPAAETLRSRLGVPVIQGYGLAEASPLTHSDGPDRPRPGSVGPPLRDTECRIVAPDTGAVLPPGEAGEVQVRGPQVMRGYLHDPAPVDAEGWLSTGDIGRLDEGGRLYLVDRIKDVFKCDNYLVSPSEVERALRAHPDVADCAVFDHPDPVGGAVCAAFLVAAETAQDVPGAFARRVLAEVNARLPYYQHIRLADVVDAVPRSANGKLQRRSLRDAFIRRRASAPPRHGGTAVSGTGQSAPEVSRQVVAITKFTVKGDAAEFEQAFREHAEFMRARPGFQRAQMVRSARTPEVYINLGWWRDAPSYLAVLESGEFRGHLGRFAELADVEPQMGPVLFGLDPEQP